MKAMRVCFLLVLASSGLASSARAQKPLAENEHYQSFRSWAVSTQFPNPVPNMFKFCIDNYDKMIASGVSPTTPVTEGEVSGVPWKGTVKELKEKYCDAGQKKTAGDIAARHAPYQAALRNDKLRLVIDERHGGVSSYALPGGKYSDDARALAAAPVWFLDVGPPSNERKDCPTGGKRHIVRRYAFDTGHKLLTTTQKEYCGDPPSSAYR
jgi:hypothetical protein